MAVILALLTYDIISHCFCNRYWFSSIWRYIFGKSIHCILFYTCKGRREKLQKSIRNLNYHGLYLWTAGLRFTVSPSIHACVRAQTHTTHTLMNQEVMGLFSVRAHATVVDSIHREVCVYVYIYITNISIYTSKSIFRTKQ